MFNGIVSNATLSPKSSVATPGRTRALEVAEHPPQDYLWGQCAEPPNLWSEPGLISCRVRGRFSLGRHMAKGSILKNLVPRKTGLKIRYLP